MPFPAFIERQSSQCLNPAYAAHTPQVVAVRIGYSQYHRLRLYAACNASGIGYSANVGNGEPASMKHICYECPVQRERGTSIDEKSRNHGRFQENASTTAVAEHPRRGSISGIGPQQGLRTDRQRGIAGDSFWPIGACLGYILAEVGGATRTPAAGTAGIPRTSSCAEWIGQHRSQQACSLP